MARADDSRNAFERIRLKLLSAGLLSRGEGSVNVLAFVSRRRGEGVTTVCIGVAQALAAKGARVLLIDACSEGRKAREVLGVKRAPLSQATSEEPGFALGAEVARAPNSPFDLLAVADLAPDASHWPSARSDLGSRYDVAVLDLGSLENEAPYRWSGLVDSAVLVLDPQRTTYEILERFRTELERSPLRFRGFVLNKRPFPVPAPLYRFSG